MPAITHEHHAREIVAMTVGAAHRCGAFDGGVSLVEVEIRALETAASSWHMHEPVLEIVSVIRYDRPAQPSSAISLRPANAVGKPVNGAVEPSTGR